VVATALLGLIYTVDSASYDGARWQASRAAIRAGYAPRDIGGNFEFVNFYAEHPGTGVRKRERFCVLVALLQPGEPTTSLVARARYKPPFHHSLVVAAQRTADPCRNSKRANP